MAINKGYLTAKTDKASDEVYTPRYAIEPLRRYLEAAGVQTVWCPFDKEWSMFVTLLREWGFTVIHSHIDDNKNFFYYEPEEHYDIIVSNPPFSLKDDVIKRLDELGKPYAMLLPINVLQGQKRFKYMRDVQMLTFDKRINYYQDEQFTIMQKGAAFASGYLCRDFLPRDLIIEELAVD